MSRNPKVAPIDYECTRPAPEGSKFPGRVALARLERMAAPKRLPALPAIAAHAVSARVVAHVSWPCALRKHDGAVCTKSAHSGIVTMRTYRYRTPDGGRGELRLKVGFDRDALARLCDRMNIRIPRGPDALMRLWIARVGALRMAAS